MKYDASGKISRKQTYKHDEKGNMTESVRYDASGEITSKQTYKHDEKGNRTEWVSRDYGEITGKNTYKYDAKGNKIKMTISRPRTAFGETRFVPTKEQTWEFTYWD